MDMNIPYSVVQSNRVQEYIAAKHEMSKAGAEMNELGRQIDTLTLKIKSFWIKEKGEPYHAIWIRKHYDVNWKDAVILQQETNELVRLKGLLIDANRRYQEYSSKVAELIKETQRIACCKGALK